MCFCLRHMNNQPHCNLRDYMNCFNFEYIKSRAYLTVTCIGKIWGFQSKTKNTKGSDFMLFSQIRSKRLSNVSSVPFLSLPLASGEPLRCTSLELSLY